MEEDRRGVLYPRRLPEFHRLPPGADLEHAVRWFWIPEWQLPDGVESRQEILPFPACNLVVEADGVSVTGPPTQRSERVLSGSGWAVGALLRPAAVPALIPNPAELRDALRPVEGPDLHASVAAAMSDPEMPGAARRERAVEAMSRWILARVPRPDGDGVLANALAEALADPRIVRVDQLADRLHVSVRTIQRLAERFFGLSPHSMIRRRRLQEAAERLREDAGLRISELASELGYADHAHFTSDFKAALGLAPSDYRATAGGRG